MGTEESPVRAMEIRAARPGDLDLLTDLARRAKATWDYPKSWLRVWESELEFTPEDLDRWRILVAQEGGRPVGVLALSADDTNPAAAEIEHLWVEPEAQGRGIGLALMKAGVDWAREAGVSSLRVESDPNARRFYERCGAIYEGETPAPAPGDPHRTLPVLKLAVPAGRPPAVRTDRSPSDQVALLELVDRIETKRRAARRHSLFALLGVSPAWILPMAGLAADFGVGLALVASVLVTGVESWRAIQARADLKEAEETQRRLLSGFGEV